MSSRERDAAMGGFCGWIDWSEAAERRGEVLERMAARLDAAPRAASSSVIGERSAIVERAGPAPSALWEQDGYCALVQGHLTLAGSREPWNGEQNAARLLLELWREHGTGALGRIGGGFALVVLAPQGEDSLLAVDRIGGRFPLSYSARNGSLIFSTRTDAIAAHPLVRSEVDPQGVYDYLYCHVVPAPRSCRSGVRQLTPASCVLFRGGEARHVTYWKPVYRPDRRAGLRELCDEFRGLVRSSVERYAHGAKVGCFLSGGTDSSTIAGHLGPITGAPARTYSIGFRASGYDEMEYARAAAVRYGTDHHEYYVSPDDVLQAIPRVVRAYSEPFGNASAVPTYYCARLARADGSERLLGGDGGDELFAGNRRYAFQKTLGLYDGLPVFARRALERALFSVPADTRIVPLRKARSYVEQARMPMPLRLQSYNYFERDHPARILDPDYLKLIDLEEPRALQAEVYHGADAQTMLERMLALDLKFTLADDDLPKVSRMCHAAEIDVAYPFLGEEMVEFSCRVPARLKLKGFTLRWFMKHALRDFLPPTTLRKAKHGFGMPFGIWMREHPGLREFALASLDRLKARRLIRTDYIDELVRQHQVDHATYYGVMIWVLMMLEQWLASISDS